MAVTIDTSAAAAWFLPDEASPTADRLYAQAIAGEESFHAPGLWVWEMGNLLHMARRRGRLTDAQQAQSVALLHRASVRLETAPDEARMRQTLSLAAKHVLSFYDASYLEQARRMGSQLATKDRALRAAAVRCGVVCIEL